MLTPRTFDQDRVGLAVGIKKAEDVAQAVAVIAQMSLDFIEVSVAAKEAQPLEPGSSSGAVFFGEVDEGVACGLEGGRGL